MCDEKYCDCEVSKDGQEVYLGTDTHFYCDGCELQIKDNPEW